MADYVYFASAAGMTKVGTSSDVRSRLASLRRLVPVELHLTYAAEGGRSLEVALHRRLAADGRHVFREWFEGMTRAQAVEAVRAARRVERDSTAEGFQRLVDLGAERLRRALEAEVGSEARSRHLDDAAEVASRLEVASGPSSAAERLYAEVFAARLGFEVPERRGTGYALPAEPPARVAPAAWAEVADLGDL